MSLTLAVTGNPAVSFDSDTITLGSDARCGIQISDGTDVRLKHAHIRRVDGIWTIQAYAENTFTVGRSQPLQTHRLRSGDVIRLSSDSSPIVFDPIEDKPLTIFDDDTPLALVDDDKRMSLSTHEISLTETVPFLPVTTPKETPAVPASNPAPKTGTISVPKSRSSDSIPAKSGAMRTTKSASSASLSTRKGQSSAAVATRRSSGEIPAQARQSDTAIDTNEVLRRSLEMAITDTDASETSDDADMIDLPVLQRLSSSSSWEEELPEAPRRRSAQKDEMKWVMMVVGRIVAAGAVVLVLLMIISAIRKSMEAPTAAPVSMSVIESSATC